MQNYPDFIQKLKDIDTELYQLTAANFDLTMQPGILDAKTKFLILLAVDTVMGSSGVKGIAHAARKTGADEEEIKEALRIAYLVSANKAIHTGINAF